MQEHKNNMSICKCNKRGCNCKEVSGRCPLRKFNELSIAICNWYNDGIQRRLNECCNKKENG